MTSSMQTKKGSVLNYDLYRLFQEYIRGGCTVMPDSCLLETMVVGPVNNSAKRKRLRKKFKSWAARLATRPIDGRLVYKSTGKLIVPEEYFVSTIERKHCGNGQKHLSLTQTIDAVMAEYSVGKREFGIDRDLIVAVVNHCPNPECQRACIQRQHHRNSAQTNTGFELRQRVLPYNFLYHVNEDTNAIDPKPEHKMEIQENEAINERKNWSPSKNEESWCPGKATRKRCTPYDFPGENKGWSHFKICSSNIKSAFSPSERREGGRPLPPLIKMRMMGLGQEDPASCRFAPIQPKPMEVGQDGNQYCFVSMEETAKSESDLPKNISHIPVQCVQLPRGNIASARPWKTSRDSRGVELTTPLTAPETNNKHENSPVARVDDLYYLLLKRIQVIRRVLRPSLATNNVRLPEALKTCIADSLAIIQRLRQDVPAPDTRTKTTTTTTSRENVDQTDFKIESNA